MFWVRLLIGSGSVYSRDPGFDQHTVRKVEKHYGIGDWTATLGAGFAKFGHGKKDREYWIRSPLLDPILLPICLL